MMNHNTFDMTTVWKDERGNYHREDGPAFIYSDGDHGWFFHGKLHRLNGPAVEYFSEGKYLWFIRGVFLGHDFPVWAKETGIDPYDIKEADISIIMIRSINNVAPTGLY